MRNRGISLLFCLFLLFASAACTGARDKTLEIVYCEEDSSIIVTEIAKTILEDYLDYRVNLTIATPAAGWAAIASDMADASLSAWLPITQDAFFQSLKSRVQIAGAVVEKAKIGLAVPAYMPLSKIQELPLHADELNKKVYGIEPGAGIMVCLESAADIYGFNNFELIDSGEAIMLASLGEAIKEKKWIVVTAWSPHAMFQMYDLKYLDDPEGCFGSEEYLTAITRKNFEEDHPAVFSLLQRMKIPIQDVEKLQHTMWQDKEPIQKLARKWVDEHREKIHLWLES